MSSPRIFYIDGNNSDRKKAIDKIIAFYSTYSLININSISAEDLIKLFTSPNCFEENKIFIISEIIYENKQSLINSIKKSIPSLSSQYIIVFNNVDLEGLKKNISSLETGKVLEYSSVLEVSEAVNVILKQFKDNEKEIDSELAQLIIKYNFEKEIDINKLELLLKKIFSFLGKQKQISEIEIKYLFEENYFNNIWQLFSQLENKDVNEAIKTWNYILYNCTTDVNSFIISSLYIFLWKYKGLFLAKEELFNVKNINLLKEFNKLTSKGLKESITCSVEKNKLLWSLNQLNSFQISANNYSRKELRMILSSIEWGLVASRKGLYGKRLQFIMDVILLTCCGKLTDTQLESIING